MFGSLIINFYWVNDLDVALMDVARHNIVDSTVISLLNFSRYNTAVREMEKYTALNPEEVGRISI